MKTFFIPIVFAGFTVLLAVCSAKTVWAQDSIAPILVPSSDPRISGLAGSTGNTSSAGTGTTTGGGTQSSSGSQGGSVNTGGFASSGTIDPTAAVNLETSVDLRNQGFVGATAPGIQNLGFVGATSENSGPALVAGASFGGGVNATGGGGTAGGSRAGAGGFQQQGFGGIGTQNGFSVTRQSLRAQLVPRFSSPQISAVDIQNRFNSGFNRLPTTQNFSKQYQVSVEGTTATVTGVVPTSEESDRLIRQLRLQPGIYQINNQLQIAQ